MLSIKNPSKLLRFSYLYEKTSRKLSASSLIDFDSSMKKLIDSKQYRQALDLFERQSQFRTDISVNMALKACIQLHDHRRGLNIIKLSPQTLDNRFTQTSLIRLYMQCHDVDNAHRIFSTMTNKSNVTYAVMFKGYVANNLSEKVFDLLNEMTLRPDKFTLAILFKACAQVNDERARRIGNQLLTQMPDNYQYEIILLNSAISMLMKFGDVKNAERLFELIKKKDPFSYSAMLIGYFENDMSQKALDLFEQMSIHPNCAIYSIIFKACAQLANERAITLGKKLVDKILNESKINNIVLTSALHMLMRFSDVAGAAHLFESIKQKDVISYGAMMQGYHENDMSEKALDLFEQMPVDSDNVIYAIVFKACAQLANERAKKLGKKLIDEILNESKSNNVVLNSALHMLMRFGDVKGAEHLFELIKKKDMFSFGAMMQGYLDNEMPERVLDLFEQMPRTADNTIYTIILTTCAKLKSERARKIGKQLLDQISDVSEAGNFVLHSSIHFLMGFGDVKGAERLFESIKQKDVVSYGAMMQGYLENDMNEKVLDLFERMSVDPNHVIYSSIFKACAQLANERAIGLGKRLLHQVFNESKVHHIVLTSALYMLMRFGDMKYAENLFKSIQNKDISTYACMMRSYNLNKYPLQSLHLFHKVKQQGFAPDEIMFTLLVNACSQIGLLAVCQSLVTQIPSHLCSKQRLSNALIDMWGKAGSVKNAQEIFTTIVHPNIFAYISMINAFGMNGRGLEAVDLFQQISHPLRNEILYICVLNSCSHSGLLNEARAIYEQIHMKTKRITTTMIDCLSRLYLFDEAQQVLLDYEKSNAPCSPMYMAIMSGARNCRDSAVSEKLFNQMKTVFPNQRTALISGSILLANIYSSLGDEDQVAIIRSDRRTNYGNKVKPGLAWTEKDGELAEFSAHDHSHPLSSEIHDELKQVSHEMVQHGFRFDPSWITRSLGEDETIQSVLCGHSEKLAVAFHFIRGRRPSFIQVTKNLRICGDCHQATKFIAKIRQCEIVLRDANRIHHFSKNGTCSCQDHF